MQEVAAVAGGEDASGGVKVRSVCEFAALLTTTQVAGAHARVSPAPTGFNGAAESGVLFPTQPARSRSMERRMTLHIM